VILRALVACLVVLAPRAAWACPVCFGQNDSPLASAINLGVIAMLGVVVGVLTAFASFIVYLVRRARMVATHDTALPLVSRSDPQEGTAQC
jgi:hypothetical protein